jgi:prepilin-type N-terminal cleavage/methylation domain-containing protein
MMRQRGRARTAHTLRDEQFPPKLNATNRMRPIVRIHAGTIHHRSRTERGFSLLELVVVMAIAVTVATIAIAGFSNSIRQAKADGGLAQVEAALQAARELSISQRRNVELQFAGDDMIQLIRIEVPGPSTTMMRSMELEGGVEFRLTDGVPNTPDALGNASALAIGSSALPAMFTTDGSFIDANGDVTNATLFLGKPGDSLAARAISIFGPTGAMRLWAWNGRAWVES